MSLHGIAGSVLLMLGLAVTSLSGRAEAVPAPLSMASGVTSGSALIRPVHRRRRCRWHYYWNRRGYRKRQWRCRPRRAKRWRRERSTVIHRHYHYHYDCWRQWCP